MTKQGLLSVAAVAAGLILAYLMDRLVRAFTLNSSRTFQMTGPFAGIMLIELLFAAVMAFLFWLILLRDGKSTLIGWLLIALGLLAFALASPYLIYQVSQAHDASLIGQVRGIPFLHRSLIFLTGKAYFFTRSVTAFGFLSKAGALTLALGAVDLLKKPQISILPQS